jgi:hypothetical protein
LRGATVTVSEYPRFKSLTETVRNKLRVQEQIDSLLEEEGPDGMYEYHQGPIFWPPESNGVQRMTFVYKLKEKHSGQVRS